MSGSGRGLGLVEDTWVWSPIGGRSWVWGPGRSTWVYIRSPYRVVPGSPGTWSGHGCVGPRSGWKFLDRWYGQVCLGWSPDEVTLVMSPGGVHWVRDPTGDTWVHGFGVWTTKSVVRSGGFLKSPLVSVLGVVSRVVLRDLLDWPFPKMDGLGQKFLTLSADEEVYTFAVVFRYSYYLFCWLSCFISWSLTGISLPLDTSLTVFWVLLTEFLQVTRPLVSFCWFIIVVLLWTRFAFQDVFLWHFFLVFL